MTVLPPDRHSFGGVYVETFTYLLIGNLTFAAWALFAQVVGDYLSSKRR